MVSAYPVVPDRTLLAAEVAANDPRSKCPTGEWGSWSEVGQSALALLGFQWLPAFHLEGRLFGCSTRRGAISGRGAVRRRDSLKGVAVAPARRAGATASSRGATVAPLQRAREGAEWRFLVRTNREKQYDRQRSRRAPTEQEVQIFDEWSRGSKGSDLARKYGCDKSTVSRLVRKVQSWRAAVEMPETEALREESVATLTRLIGEAEAAWQKSREPATKRRTSSGENSVDETTITSSHGDSTMLLALTKLIDLRAKISGVSGPPAPPVSVAALQINMIPPDVIEDASRVAWGLRRAQLESAPKPDEA